MVDRSFLKCEHIRYTPQSIHSPDRSNEQIYIDITMEGSVIYLKVR